MMTAVDLLATEFEARTAFLARNRSFRACWMKGSWS